MKRASFTEEQIIAVLKEHGVGAKSADLARKHGVAEATLYNWKAKFGGMDISEAKRRKALEEGTRPAKAALCRSFRFCRSADPAPLPAVVLESWIG